jgi:hypothetical protein
MGRKEEKVDGNRDERASFKAKKSVLLIMQATTFASINSINQQRRK